MNLDELKEYLKLNGITIHPDMKALVETIDKKKRSADTIVFASNENFIKLLGKSSNVSFFDTYHIRKVDEHGGVATLHAIRFASW